MSPSLFPFSPLVFLFLSNSFVPFAALFFLPASHTSSLTSPFFDILSYQFPSFSFQTSLDPLNSDRLETVTDISKACQMALSILNDLLNYDKLEDGT